MFIPTVFIHFQLVLLGAFLLPMTVYASTSSVAYDYPEIDVDTKYDEIREMAAEATHFLDRSPNPFDQKLKASSAAYATRLQKAAGGAHCEDLWSETCADEVGYDPTGYVLGTQNAEFGQLLPGFTELMQPKMLQVVEFLFASEYEYAANLKRRFSGRDLNGAKTCVAEAMVHKVISDFARFRLDCFQGNQFLLRDLISSDDQNYFVNRVRRIFRAKFAKSQELRRIQYEILPRVKDLVALYVSRNVANLILADKIVTRLNNIELLTAECPHLGVDQAYYNPVRNTVAICYGHIIKNRSLFATVHVLAHELAHSFDPIAFGEGRFSGYLYKDFSDLKGIGERYPFDGALKCLARKESVAARFLTTPADILKSQFGESMADLVAADVLADYMRIYESQRVRTAEDFRLGAANVWKSLCGRKKSKEEEAADEHPSLANRTNLILGAHPKIRKAMACSQEVVSASCR